MIMAEELKITSGRKDYIQPAAAMLAPCFYTDPALTFMLQSYTQPQREAYMETYFAALFKASMVNQGIICEIDDWKGAAVWMPPGKAVDGWRSYFLPAFWAVIGHVGLSGLKHMLVDFQAQSNKAKKKGLGGRKFYYLFFIATQQDQRGRGLTTKLIRQYQDIARKEGYPVWLEATTKHSRDIYEHLGFTEIAEMRLGKGSAAETGLVQKDGPGVPLWAMLWEPDNTKKR